MIRIATLIPPGFILLVLWLIGFEGFTGNYGQHAAAQQQQPPISTTALQQQRNLALDWQAQAVAQIELLAQENAKLKARVQELEKLSEKKPD